jgi:hypothetical protein
MPRVVFEPMIPAFERAKTVHACTLDHEVTVIGLYILHKHENTDPCRVSNSLCLQVSPPGARLSFSL